MMSMSAPRRIGIVLVCVAIGLLAAFTQYVHTGYVGVVDGSNPLRLLDRGLHIRAPWKHVVFYPTQGNSVGITTTWKGPRGTLTTEITLAMSVCRDSVASLHAAYGGEYVEALVVPSVNEFLKLRKDAWGDWRNSSVVDQTDRDLAVYLNASLASRGINIFQAWLVSFEESAGQLD